VVRDVRVLGAGRGAVLRVAMAGGRTFRTYHSTSPEMRAIGKRLEQRGARKPAVPLDLPVVFPDWCVRCGRVWIAGELSPVVTRQRAAVALRVCEHCFDPESDYIIGVSAFAPFTTASGGMGVGKSLPAIQRRPAAEPCYIKLAYCSDGQWRIALKRGLPEVWTGQEVVSLGLVAPLGSYTADGLFSIEGVLPIREEHRLFASLNSDHCFEWAGGDVMREGPYSRLLALDAPTPISPIEEEPPMREPTVKIYRNNDSPELTSMAVTSTATDADEFLRELANELPAVVASMNGDQQFAFAKLLPQVCELWAKYRGYKADGVFERRMLVTGEPNPEAAQMMRMNADRQSEEGS
jgi:hypothetical protein